MTSEAPQMIGLISDGFGNWALATVDEAEHSVKYTLTTHALAMVAAAYGDAAEAVADYPRTAPHRDEWIAYDEQIEHSQRCICALTPADAQDALDAMLKAERVKALREAADCIGHITQAEDREAIYALIEKETDNE